MELWQLRTFTSVAKHLHFTRASEDLNLSQPAVSHQIKALEEEIGEPLFLRGAEGITLTKTGQTMYKHAEKILDMAEELSLEIKESRDFFEGDLVVGAATQGLNTPFSKVHKEFIKKFPLINLVFHVDQTPESIAGKVRDGTLDVGVLGRISDLSGLSIMPYGEFKFVCVAGKDHPLAKKKKITAEDLKNQKWVMLKPPSRLRLWAEEGLAKIGVQPYRIVETNDGSLIRSILADSERLSVLPVWGAIEDIRDGKIVPLKVGGLDINIELICVWKEGKPSKAVSALVTHILEEQVEGVVMARSKEK